MQENGALCVSCIGRRPVQGHKIEGNGSTLVFFGQDQKKKRKTQKNGSVISATKALFSYDKSRVWFSKSKVCFLDSCTLKADRTTSILS